jgi:hypothetical protein
LTTFLATLVVFGFAVVAMAIGVMVQGKRLQGSCGGSDRDCVCSALEARRCARRRTAEGV